MFCLSFFYHTVGNNGLHLNSDDITVMNKEFGGGIEGVRGSGQGGLMRQPLKLTTFLRGVMKSPPPTPIQHEVMHGGGHFYARA